MPSDTKAGQSFKARLANTVSALTLNRTQRNVEIREAEAAIEEIEKERLPAVDTEIATAKAAVAHLEAELLGIEILNPRYNEIAADLFHKLNNTRSHVELLVERKRAAVLEELAAHRLQLQRLQKANLIARWKQGWRTYGNLCEEAQGHLDELGRLWPALQERREQLIASWPVGSPPLTDTNTLLTPASLAHAMAVAQYRTIGIAPHEKGKHPWPEPHPADLRNPVRDAAPTLQEAHEATTAFLLGLLDGPGVIAAPDDEDDEQTAA